MFELDGQPLSLEELQGFAKDNNIDFGAYMTNMKNAGMVEKQIDSPSPIIESGSVSVSVDGGLDLPSLESVQDRTMQSNIVMPEIIEDPSDVTLADIEMSDEESIEFDRRAKEQREKGIEGQKLYLRQTAIKDKTGLLPIQVYRLVHKQ